MREILKSIEGVTKCELGNKTKGTFKIAEENVIKACV